MPKEDDRGPKPTIVPAPPARKKTAPVPASSPPRESGVPTGLRPTAIAGTERQRLPVEASQLRALSPGCDAAVSNRALALLAGFVVEKANERRAILWGHDTQKAHSELVGETLRLSQTPAFRQVEGYIKRMIEILQAIDVVAASGHGQRGIAGYFRNVNSRIDTPDELDVAQRELDQLVKYMSRGLDELLALKGLLESQADKLENLALDAEAAALAALFLSRHFERDKPAVSQCFIQRSMSLTQTLAQIRQNDTVRDLQINYPLRLVAAIQNVALVAMPDVIASITTVVTLAGRDSTLSPTEAGELNYKLRDVLNKLAI
jgi:hypothetical protein